MALTYSNLANIPGLKNSLGTALQNKINPSPLPPVKSSSGSLNPFSGIASSFSKYWNNTGPGRFHNPASSDYIGTTSVYGKPAPSTGSTSQTNTTTPPATQQNNSGVISSSTQPKNTTSTVPLSTTSSTNTTSPAPTVASTNGTNTGSSTTMSSPTFNYGVALPTNPYQASVGGLGAIAANSTDSNNPQSSINSRNALDANSYLRGITGTQSPEVTKAQEDYNKFAQSSPYMIAAQSNPNVAADVASGRSSLLGQTFAQELAAKQNAVSNALTGQGQQIGAAENAGSQALTGQNQQITAGTNAAQLTKPEAGASYFGSPYNGGLVGGSGNALSGGSTGNQLIDTQVNQAIQNISTGASTSDATSQIANNPIAMAAFQSRMQKYDPNWNPTSSNAIAQANMATAQKYIQQGADIQNGISTLNKVANDLVPNMGTTGFNPFSSPLGNQTFSEYYTEKNPAAKAGITKGLQDIETQVSKIISASTGMTPSGVTEQIQNSGIDFKNLNPQQLSDFIQYVNNYAQSNLGSAQSAVQGATRGYGAYMGAPATSNSLPNPQSNGTGQAGVMTGASLGKGLLSSIGNHLNAVTGAAAGGLAESVLGL